MTQDTQTQLKNRVSPLFMRLYGTLCLCLCVTTLFIMAEYETIYGQVVAKANNYQAVPDGRGGRRIIKSDAVRDYEWNFKKQCRVYAGRMINAPFTLEVVVFESSRRYDLDNSLKTLLDCLQMCGAITDDNLCIEIRARKAIDTARPRVVFAIHETEPRMI